MSHKQSVPVETIHSFLVEELSGIVPLPTWGEVSYFYNPGRRLKRGTYLATIKEKDGENDRGSHLDRPGVWRLNIGVAKSTYQRMFGPPPPRPGKGAVIEGPWDFTQLDQVMPHPVYGWMGWIAVLSPSAPTWSNCQTLIRDAHDRARLAFAKRTKGHPASIRRD